MVKLYLVEIGGMRDGALFECHEVHAMIASDEEELVRDCAIRFRTIMRASHLDGWMELDLDYLTDQKKSDNTSFFVAELGRNSANAVREEHDYRFISASNVKEAVQTVRKNSPEWHVDACINLDDLVKNAGYALYRDNSGKVPEPRAHSCYVRFLE